MSFKEGDLHILVDDLKAKNDKLAVTNGELCATINKQQARIYKLENLVKKYDAEFSETITWVDTKNKVLYFDRFFKPCLFSCREEARALGLEVGGEPYEFEDGN